MGESEGRRNDFQVLRDILVAAQSGALKTNIVYKANSNFKHVKGYLQQALDSGLLREDGDRYYTTDKGCEVVARVIELELLLRCSYGSAGEVAPVG